MAHTQYKGTKCGCGCMHNGSSSVNDDDPLTNISTVDEKQLSGMNCKITTKTPHKNTA